MSMACFALSGYSQQQWEKLTSYKQETAKINANGKVKPYKDKDYNYGSEQVPSPRNQAVTWQDSKGILWLFGGIGYDENYEWGVFQDMWKYTPRSNQWALVTGDRNKSEQQIKGSSQIPAARQDAASWVDNRGDLWMFGGRQLRDFLHLDDMWVFDTSKGQWASVSGKGEFNRSSVRGRKGEQGSQSTPGSRSCATTWTDRNGDLWLFGGQAYDPETVGTTKFYNDLWRFDTQKRQWQWVSGSEKPNQPVDTLLKVTEREPSSRCQALGWFDEKENGFWMYGGVGYGASTNAMGGLSDMWFYSIKSGKWEMRNGSFKINAEAYNFSGAKGSKENSPGRRANATIWRDKAGLLYLMGGHNQLSNDMIYIEKGVWKFDPGTNLWNVLPDLSSAVTGKAATLSDADGTLYLFGGGELDQNTLQTRPTNLVWRLKK